MKLSYILILASLPVLASCNRDTRPDWQKAESAPHLTIPASVDTPGRSAEMVVPDATGDSEAMAHNDTTPPMGLSLTSEDAVGTAWQTVSNRLDSVGIGTIVNRDDVDHRLSLNVKGSELPKREDGFFSRLFGSKPDPSRNYFAVIDVISQNGQTMVNINGDGRAVLPLSSLLEGGSLKPVAQKGGAVSTAAPRTPLRDSGNVQRDASGRRSQ